MSYTDATVDLTTPTSGTAANTAPASFIEAKRVFKERWADVTGCNPDVDPNVPTKYGDKININTSQVRSKEEYDNGNSGTSKTVNWDNGNYQKIVATGDCTVTFSNLRATATLTLRITSSTGRTFTWPASVKWANANVPTLSGVMIITFYSPDGTTVYAATALTNAL